MTETMQPQSRLSEALDAIGMTEADLASKVGVTRQAINQIVRGEKMPSLALAGAIARVVGGTVDGLFLAAESSTALDDRNHGTDPVAAPTAPSGQVLTSTAADGTGQNCGTGK